MLHSFSCDVLSSEAILSLLPNNQQKLLLCPQVLGKLERALGVKLRGGAKKKK